MEDQLKRMYFFATKDRNFTGNQTSNKYLPLKNNTISYQSLFDVSKNINQLKLTLNGGKTIREHSFRNKNNIKQVSRQKYQKNQKYETNLNDIPTLISIYKANKPRRKNYDKSATDKASLGQKHKQNSPITIINNPECQIEQKTKLATKLLKTESKSSRNKGNQLEQPNLDLYIDQYLQQLLESDNVDIREEIQSDRQKFILKAISKIKCKILNHNKNVKQQYGVEDERQNPKGVNGKSEKYTKYNQIEAQNQQHLEETQIQPEQTHRKGRKIKDSSINGDRQKRKSKSTQLIPALDANEVRSQANFRDRNNKNIDQSVLNRNGDISSQLPILPSRKIYSITPTSSFIRKVGRTFYLNELNVLNKTLELQAKNRERAQRFFKRKLLNIQNQYNRVLDKEKKNVYAHSQQFSQIGQPHKADKNFSSYDFY